MSAINPSILIFGALPPPLGGVSVFLQRHVTALEREGRTVKLLDWSGARLGDKIGWVLRLLFAPEKVAVEIHGFQTVPKLAVLLRPFPTNSTLWLHSGQFASRLNGWRRRLLRVSLKRFTNVVFVSGHISDLLEDAGIVIDFEPTIQHAFLPPQIAENDIQNVHSLDSFGADVQTFVSSANPLLVIQGSDAFHQGVDRYGTDIAIEALVKIREVFPSAQLLIGCPSVGSQSFRKYRASLDLRIAELELPHEILFLENEQELWPLIAKAAVFLRPTNQDGDSISVREALHFGVPVVASDACPRPSGCKLFESRNHESLADEVLSVLEAGRSHARETTALGDNAS